MNSVLTSLMAVIFSFMTVNASALQLYCPSDVWLPCNAEIWDLSGYGNAYYIKHGIQYSAGLPNVQYHLTQCNTGTIVRTWQIEDEHWNIISCSQTIYVEGGNFNYNNIHWPETEILVTGCNTSILPDDLPEGFQRPTWDWLSCSMVASSYKDQVFIFSDDCKKIIRKWTVLDWCTYTPGGNKGIYTKSQIIKVSNMEQPVLSCTKNVTVRAERCDSAYVKTEPVFVEGVSCTGTFSVRNDSPYADNLGPDASGTYPLGKTKFNYIVNYACGNEVICETEVVVNLKGPVPYCLAGLNVALMPVDTNADGIVDDGMVEIWAKDLNIGSYHPCNNKPLHFSFSSDITDMSRAFTCAQVGYNTVEMWVTDYLGNQSYCLVNIHVQNNNANIPNCAPDVGAKHLFSGTIIDDKQEAVENVIITAKDHDAMYDFHTEIVETVDYVIIDSFYNQAGLLLYIFDTVLTQDTIVTDSTAKINVHYLYTDTEGVFKSDDIPMNRNYEVSAYKSDEMDKIDEDDLAILLGFLTDRYAFKSPYSYLIADINEDGYLTMEDYHTLEELVSGDEDEWPKERQWVFYNLTEMSEMSDQPLEDNLTETQNVYDYQNKASRLDLMGILKGDLTKYETANFQQEQVVNKRDIKEINVYPNPFSEELIINNPNSEDLTISIFSLDGKLINSYNRVESRIQLKEMGSLLRGTYFYKIDNGIEIISGKVVKI